MHSVASRNNISETTQEYVIVTVKLYERVSHVHKILTAAQLFST